MKTKKTTVALLFVCAFLAVGLALGQEDDLEPGPGAGPGPGPGARGLARLDPDGGGRWWTQPQIIERLKLTPEQQTRIDAISLKHGERMIDLRAARQKAQLTLAHRIDAGEIDGSAVDKLIEDVAQASCALEREHLTTRVEIARVLAKEQRLALREIVGERALRGRDRPGRQDRAPR